MRRSKLSPDEAAALAAEYLRLGNTDPREGDPGLFLNKALDLLAPHTRDRAPSYFVFTTLAEVYAARGELSDLRQAVDLHDAALIDTQMPPTVKGWTESQRNWIEKLDREYVPHYLRLRLADREQATRRSPETEVPTALFPLPSKGQTSIPLRFVNDAGSYEPGSLAKTELDKLPRDALAIAQQLVFWFPGDTRLLWMVAELYAAEGKLDEAETFFNEIAGSRQFGNRKIFMEHRRMVSEAIETRRKAAEQAAADAMPISLRAIWIYFGAVVLIAAVALLRVFTKRGKGSAWPGCCG